MKVKVKGEWKWLWNMMDEKTRFQLVSMIADTREAQNAKRTFKKSKEVAGNRPRLVVTDGLPGYHSAFNTEFWDQRRSVMHIANVALQSGLNNSIERMHGRLGNAKRLCAGLRAWKRPLSKAIRSILTLFVRIRLWKGRRPQRRQGLASMERINGWDY